MQAAEPWSFWAANSTAICKRICTFPLNGLHRKKKFFRTRSVYLVWAVQRAYWKGSEQEKQWWEGGRSESRRNSYNGTFDQKLLPDHSGIPDSGKPYEWFILTALVNIQRSITLCECEVTAMGSSVKRLTFKKVLRPLALLAASRPKMPAPQNWFNCMYYVYFNKQLVIKIITNFTASNIHCPQLARTLRNSRGWYIASLASSHESEVKWFIKRQNWNIIYIHRTPQNEELMKQCQLITNRPFPSSHGPLFQNEGKCSAFHMEIKNSKKRNRNLKIPDFWLVCGHRV